MPTRRGIEENLEEEQVMSPREMKLPVFGERDVDPETWLSQVEAAAQVATWSSPVMTKQAAASLRGTAATWWASLYDQPTEWPKFCEEFRQQFIYNSDRACDAYSHFLLACQRGQGEREAVAEYIPRLRLLAKRAGVPEERAVLHVQKGLRPEIRRQLRTLTRETWAYMQQTASWIEQDTPRTHGSAVALLSGTGSNSHESNLAIRSPGKKMIKCFKCGQLGHIARGCRSGEGGQAPPQPRPGQAKAKQNASVYVSELSTEQINREDSLAYSVAKIHIELGETQVWAIVDTGSSATIISARLVQQLRLKVNRENPQTVLTSSGSSARSVGTIKDLLIKVGSQSTKIDAIVMEVTSYSLLLGNDILHRMSAAVDIGKEVLITRFKGLTERIPLSIIRQGHRRPEPRCHLIATKGLQIPAHGQRWVPVKTDGSALKSGYDYTISSTERMAMTRGVKAASGVISGEKAPSSILIANLSNREVRVSQGEKVAFVASVIDVDECPELSGGKAEDGGVKMEELWPTATTEESEELKRLFGKHRAVCEKVTGKKLVKSYVEFDIKLEPNVMPIKQRFHHVSPAQAEIVRNEIDMMLKEGFIERSTSAWASPVVLVRKKDGSTRFCVDYRKLNNVTCKDVYPLPRIQEALDSFAGASVFSTLDLKSGYWQIPIKKEARDKTAFISRHGLYQWRVMPFGLCNAPATFQRMMDAILEGIKWEYCLVYLDDIMVYSKDFKEHIRHLDVVLSRLEQAGLKLNLKKCKIARAEVSYLGHVIDKSGVRPDNSNTEAVKDYPRPKNVKEMRTFLGLASYYRRFVKDFASLADPLFKLCHPKEKFEWGEIHEKAFESLKKALISPPVLAHPDPAKPYIIQTDASDVAIGAILAQSSPEGERVVAYGSHSLDVTQRRYCATERECLAIVWALQQFRPYVYGRPFQLMTDHSALQYLKSAQYNGNSKLIRWALQLSEFDFTVIHKKGSTNGNVDALSRSPREERFEAAFLTEGEPGKYRKIKKQLWYQPFPGGPLRKVIPEKARKDLTIRTHLALGHAGEDATYAQLTRKFYWENMIEDVRTILGGCDICQRYGKNRQTIRTYPITAKEPFEMVGIDLMGPLPETRRGSKYILVATDYLTHWTIGEAIPDKGARTVANVIFQRVVCFRGPPKRIITDQGNEFTNQLVESLCRAIGTKHILASPYHPQTNGLVERTNQTIIAKLTKLVNGDVDNWDMRLAAAVYAYNCSPQKKLLGSPFELMFGEVPRIWNEPEEPSEAIPEDNREAAIRRMLKIQENQEIARQAIETRAEETEEREQEKRSAEDLRVGDAVLVRHFERDLKTGKKLLPYWKGPFFVQKKGKKGRYIVGDLHGHPRTLNRCDLRLDRGEEWADYNARADVELGSEGGGVMLEPWVEIDAPLQEAC